MPRTPPPRSETEQRDLERRKALKSLDVAALRAWAEKWAIGLVGDDRTVLISAHEARMIDPATPVFLRRESVRWLRDHYPESEALRDA